MVDLAAYNKLLTEKKKLSDNLKKLQVASKKALQEFNDLKEQYAELSQENDYLRDQMKDLEGKNRSLEVKYNDKSTALKQIVKVSKAAVQEFNELKQRYTDEVERRQSAETALYELQAKVQNQNIAQKSTHEVSEKTVGVAVPGTTLEKELAKMKVQLQDTISEFQKFKELAVSRNKDLEQKIQEEISLLATTMTTTRGKAVQKAVGSKSVKGRMISVTSISSHDTNDTSADSITSSVRSLPRDLSSDIQRGLRLKHVEPSQPPKPKHRNREKHITVYSKGGFGDLGALLAQSKQDNDGIDKRGDIAKEPPVSTSVREPVPLKNATLKFSGSKSREILEKLASEDDDDVVKSIAARLLETSRETQNIIEKRSSRIAEAAGKAPLLSEYSLSRRQKHATQNLSDQESINITNISDRTLVNSSLDHQSQSEITMVNMRDSNATIRNNAARSSLLEIQELFDELENELGVKL